jgi:hypothetical protein
MVYDTRDYWDFGLGPLSSILKNTKEHKVSETDPVSEALCSLMYFRIQYGGQTVISSFSCSLLLF